MEMKMWKNTTIDEFLLSFFSYTQNDTSFEYDETDETIDVSKRIMREYGNSILRLAYSYLHNMSDAEDILQDTLIQYLKKSPTFKNAQHEKAWLMTVSGNLSKNKIEYNNIRKTDELDERLVMEEKKDLSFVYQAVKSLSTNFQEVIHLFYYEGYSTKEIATILRRKESTIRSDLSRAREKLKLILQEEYDFDE